jgi:hypothetical protein
MRNRIIVIIIAVLAAVVVFAVSKGRAQEAAPARTNQFAGGNDHTGAIPSVLPPEGWKPCPRCQNQKDRADSAAKDKVEGHPFNPRDLTGVWGFNGQGNAFTNPPAMTELGKKRFAETLGDKNADGEYLHNKDTSGEGGGAAVNCDPHGWPRIHTYNYGFEFIMLPDRVLEFFELGHTWRTIWTDGRKLPKEPPEPRWMGWSVGHWEGDTFIVESNGFDERPWIHDASPDGGYIHSDEMTVTERWRRLNYATIEHQITVNDPKIYTAPWVGKTGTTTLVSGAELGENFCVPSDYATFNNQVFLPVSASPGATPKK